MVNVQCGAVKCINNDGKGACKADSIQVSRVKGKPLASCKSFNTGDQQDLGTVRGIMDVL